jgi:hypothetical protein
MKPPIVILIFTLLSCTVCFSQDYRSGYVVTNNADTIHGLISYKGNKANSSQCKFKKNKKTKPVIYTPNDIRMYRFDNGKYFISKIAPLSYGKIFLEYLINGTVDIYYYRDKKGEHYLIDNGDNKLNELTSGDVIFIMNNQKYSRRDKSYQGLLKSAFTKSPSIQKRVDDLKISHKSLIQISKDYHNEVCSSEVCVVYQENVPKSIFTWGPVISFNHYAVKNNHGSFPDEVYYLKDTDIKPQTYFAYGFFIRQNIPMFNERLFYNIEHTFHQRSFETSNKTDYQKGSQIYYIDRITYKSNSINTNVALRYEFYGRQIRPALTGGIYADINVSSKYHRVTTHKIGNSESYVGSTDQGPIFGGNFGFVAGMGLVFDLFGKKSILLDARYYLGAMPFADHTSSLKVKSFDVSFKFAL